MARVSIRGDGVAACCCEHLLRRAGFEVITVAADRPRLPSILLSDAAAGLIRDVFGRGDLFRGLPRIRKRVVAWGAEPVTLDHDGVVVSEHELLASLRPLPIDFDDTDPDWTVIASRPLPEASVEHRFGTRRARAIPVTMKGDPETCWIESLPEGWLFLVRGWLLAVGGARLEDSRVIADQIATAGTQTAEFAAYPRIVDPLNADGWLACGTAAMAFDPLCGDGTANAVREAILASAVIAGGGGEALRRHYEARLIAGFQKHLELSLKFYETGHSGEWWQREAGALRDGLAWCERKRTEFGNYRFQLRGFELVPVLP